MGAPRFVLDRFWPSNLFLGGIPGAWYDPTDLSTMFQDSTGTTPVTAVEQPVGLILDKSQGVTEGTNLRSVGAIALIGVAPVATYNTTTGAATASRVDAANQSGIQFTVTANTLYRLTVTVASGNLSMQNGTLGASALAGIGPGTTTIYLQPTTTTLTLAAQANGMTTSFTVTSLQSIAGNHASQSTAASRPTYRARYNLLTFSEDFGNAAWQKNDGATVTTDAVLAPDGTLTADALNIGVLNISRVQQPLAALTTATMSYSVWMRVASGTEQIRFGDSTALTTVTVTSVWQRFVVVVNITGTAPNLTIRNDVAGGAKTIYAWGAQLLTAADVTATGNAYQRIAAATVYDTAPVFRPYLAFDGMDDSLSTAAINFTSTDKMTTFVGTTVNSDAAPGMITELSTDGGANAGAFNVYRPGTGAYQFFRNGGTSFAQTVTGSFAAPSTGVVTYGLNFGAATEVTAQRVNGAASGAVGSADTGSGNFGTYPLFIGRRNNASLPFNGRIYSIIVRGAASSVTEIADTELWVNARTGGY